MVLVCLSRAENPHTQEEILTEQNMLTANICSFSWLSKLLPLVCLTVILLNNWLVVSAQVHFTSVPVENISDCHIFQWMKLNKLLYLIRGTCAAQREQRGNIPALSHCLFISLVGFKETEECLTSDPSDRKWLTPGSQLSIVPLFKWKYLSSSVWACMCALRIQLTQALSVLCLLFRWKRI